MTVKITEYENVNRIITMPTIVIKTWKAPIPPCASNFIAAEYIAAKYTGRLLGVTII